MNSLLEIISTKIHEASLLASLGVFVAYFVVDWLYAYYTIYVARLDARRAATVGTLIYALGALGVIEYTQNFIYIIPLVMGAWFGSYFSIAYEKRRQQKKVVSA